MTRLLQAFGVVLLAGGLAYHFAAIEIFNLVVPKDAGSKLVAERVPYGPDPRQRFDLYRPEGESAQNPVLVFVHGGGWDSGRGEPYEFVARAFAAHGYLAATVTYRVAPKNPYPDFISDTATAVKKVQDVAPRHGGDPSRVFLVGHSAGGYNVLQATLDPKYFTAAGVDPRSIKALAALAAPADFFPFDVKKSIAAFGMHPQPEETQPVNFARQDAPPILLLHGSDDATVGPHNSRNLRDRLNAAGASVQYTEYPGVGHVGIMLPLAKPLRGRTPVLRDVLAFFERYR